MKSCKRSHFEIEEKLLRKNAKIKTAILIIHFNNMQAVVRSKYDFDLLRTEETRNTMTLETCEVRSYVVIEGALHPASPGTVHWEGVAGLLFREHQQLAHGLGSAVTS